MHSTSTFDGKTLFRFPLRNRASKLSNEVYTVEKLRKLLEALKAEAKYLLLFLRSVCSIEVVEISESRKSKQVFKVCISSRDSTKRQSEQQLLVEHVESTFTGESPYAVKQVIQQTAHFNIEMIDGTVKRRYEWVVVHRIGSDNPKVLALAEKQHVLPWVGTAFEVSNTDPHSKGRIFCFLPLPTEDKTPFAIHVNGTFAVSSNRRSLKWEAQERQDDQEATWNKLLVQYCVPHCYDQLIQEVVKLPSLPHEIVYNCWPSLSDVRGTPWEEILKPLFSSILQSKNIVYTAVNGGEWIAITEAMFVLESEKVPQSVIEVILMCGVKVVELSQDLWNIILHYRSQNVQQIDPSIVRNALKGNLKAYQSRSCKEKMTILSYCLKDIRYAELEGLELVPLANKSFKKFKRNYQNDQLYLCSKDIPYTLLPGLEHMMVDNELPIFKELKDVAQSGLTQLQVLGVREVAELLPLSKPQSWSQVQLKHFWNWLQNHDLNLFDGQCIVPVKLSSGHTKILPLAKKQGIVYISQHTSYIIPDLMASLFKFGIKLADAREFSYLTHPNINKRLYRFEVGEILDALQPFDLSKTKLSCSEAIGFQNFLSMSLAVGVLSEMNIITLSKLPIFAVIQHKGHYYSLTSLKSAHANDQAIAEGKCFEFRRDLLPNKPLVISKSSNNKYLLQNLSGIVQFMNGIEFLESVVFPQIKNRVFSTKVITDFMVSVLDNYHLFTISLPSKKKVFIHSIAYLPFIKVSNGELKSPNMLFDPKNGILSQLFYGEPVFPSKTFYDHLSVLRKCGLKQVESVTAEDIFNVVTAIQLKDSNSPVECNEIQYERAVAVTHFLCEYPHLLKETITSMTLVRKTLLHALVNKASSWLPVISKPEEYLSCLSWKGSIYPYSLASPNCKSVFVPSVNTDCDSMYSIAGSKLFFIHQMPPVLSNKLSSSKQTIVTAVVHHFKEIVKNEININASVLETLSASTYEYLDKAVESVTDINIDFTKKSKWIWIENHSTFVSSSRVTMKSNLSFNLEPFIFTLSHRIKKYSNLLTSCGVHKIVSNTQVLSVLTYIKAEDVDKHISRKTAWSLVKNILEWVVQNPDLIHQYEILVPIQSDKLYPQLLPSDEVAYTDNKMLLQIAKSSDEEYTLVHSSVAHLASKLELTPLSDQLDFTEEVFEDAGQHEPLTTRLSNILKEYKDGLTIIKEMIQNADDAEATEVNILYDARSHTTDRLLFNGMADSHGPALVVHNNSTFSEEDFTNITKLAGATKKDKPLKIGKFGVGFCSVYHITDIPSFVSGEWLYIFDPTLKHLKGVVKNENQPGKRMKYMSKFIWKSQQLVPYQGLFGFNISIPYSGTMFRFPFRRSASQISSTIYRRSTINELRQDLATNGSKLLLFLNHVKKVTFQYISKDDKRPTTELLIERSRYEMGEIERRTFLTDQYHHHKSKKKENWLVSSCEIGLTNQEGYNQQSSASVACHLQEIVSSKFICQPLNKGSVFCFLPLSVPSTGLPVHVSANFAVMSNRSGIWTSTSSSSPSDSREWWNLKLMETTIPAAYCKLLNSLRTLSTNSVVIDYNYFVLWPLAQQLHIKNPWTSMLTPCYKLMVRDPLFFSSPLGKWKNLKGSTFLDLNLLNSLTNIPDSVTKAVNILRLPIVHLPEEYRSELEQAQQELLIMTEANFVNKFFKSVKSFDEHIDIRNDVLFQMFSKYAHDVENDVESELEKVLRNNDCVPCTPHGEKLENPEKLVDPMSKLSRLFDSQDCMFPITKFYKTVRVKHSLEILGLLISSLPWNMLLKCAKKIESLYRENKCKAIARIDIIIECIGENIKSEKVLKTSQHKKTIEALKNTKFLPVLSKPEHYFITWKGEGVKLCKPTQLLQKDITNAPFIVGSQMMIINTTDEGGCKHIPYRVAQFLGIETKPRLADVMKHYQCLIESFQTPILKNRGKVKLIETMCRLVYEHFDKEIKHESKSSQDSNSSSSEDEQQSETGRKLSVFKSKPFIWTGQCFICPLDVAKKWIHNGPYLYKVPDILIQRKDLIKALGICKAFSAQKLLDTLKEIWQEYKMQKLPQKCHGMIISIVQELNNFQQNDLEVFKDEAILPDKDYTLRAASSLSFNDAPWLPMTDEYHFAHENLKRDTALALGINPVRSRFLDQFTTQSSNLFSGVPFGQQEKLTQRIQNILRDYPLDVTLIKELLQNADDAKATKMCVILDKRTHGKQRIPSPKWEELQGPALLVWNNANFTEKDLEGIQKLGLGSKRDDSESIGQFGIGFNVVYHITDCPSFITGGNTLCVFDPHCHYVPGANELSPGRRYENLEKPFWTTMSDLCSAFFQTDPLPNQPRNLTKGTLFRFPLRSTLKQVEQSKIVEKKERCTTLKMETLLCEWAEDIKDALLFLNHIVQFEFFVINDKTSKFELRVNYKVNLDKNAQQKRTELQEKLTKFREFKEFYTVMYPLAVQSVLMGKERPMEKWLIQQGVGDLQNPSQNWKFIDQVLPKHGIAAPWSPLSNFQGKIFCFLPLPGSSSLPVHINGQFVLNANRRSLWPGEGEWDEKKKWNDSLIEAISSSYVQFLIDAREYCIDQEGYPESDRLHTALEKYYSLFPYWQQTDKESVSETQTSEIGMQWKELGKAVFEKLWLLNPELLVSESLEDDMFIAHWHLIHNEDDPFHQAYFHPHNKKDIIPILKMISMIITCAPHCLYKHLKCFGSSTAKPLSVFKFYSKFCHEIIQNDFPCCIQNTPFQTVQNFLIFLNYLLHSKKQTTYNEFVNSPFGHPLLLTADNQLRIFDENDKVMNSRYSYVFPKSSFRFLNESLVDLKMDQSYFCTIDNVTFESINTLMIDNFPAEMNQKEVDNSKSTLISETDLVNVWECISFDQIFRHYQTSIVNNWALLPANNGYLYSSCSPIIPIMQLMDDSTHHSTFELLKCIGIPILSQTINHSAESYCLEITDYDEILSVVYELQKRDGILNPLPNGDRDVDTLLTFFSHTTFRQNSDVMNQIKYLPLFKTVNGELTNLLEKEVYCWPSVRFCKAGYEKWAPAEQVVFLEKYGSWRNLCKHLHGSDFTVLGNNIDEQVIYINLIFPNFHKLNTSERKHHLLYIRNEVYPIAKHDSKNKKSKRNTTAVRFIHELIVLKCLEHENHAEPLTISSFCDHTIDIFVTFRNNFLFLGEEYSDDEWMRFFRDLNLRREVTFDEYLSFCKSVSEGKHDDIRKASNVLLEYLFSEKAVKRWHKNAYYLSQIGDICFVQVANMDRYSWIKAPCQPPTFFPQYNIGLTKLNQAVTNTYANLVWTVKPVVSLPLTNWLLIEENVFKNLGFTMTPSLNDVYNNIINISNTGLSNFQLFSTYDSQYTNMQNCCRVDLVKTMIANMKYLYDKRTNDTTFLQSLRTKPCIPVSAEEEIGTIAMYGSYTFPLIAKPVLVNSLQVIAGRIDEGLAPYINVLPRCLNEIDGALELIGVCHTVDLRHIQYMLETIYKQFTDQMLTPNDARLVRNCILKLADLLDYTDQDKKKEASKQLKTLYLPSIMNSKMFPSTSLLFVDSDRYKRHSRDFKFSDTNYSLFKIPRDRAAESSSEEERHSKRLTEKDICLRLPKDVRPKGLSLHCQESVVQVNQVSVKSSLHKHFSTLKLMCNSVRSVLQKILRSELTTEDQAEEFTTSLMKLIEEMDIVTINNLEAKVTLDCDETPVHIGTIAVKYILQKDINSKYTLYVDSDASSSGYSVWKDVAHTFCIEVARILNKYLTTFIKLEKRVCSCIKIQDREDLEQVMEKYEIDDMGITSDGDDDDTVELGRPIPDKWLSTLDNDINNIFRAQEWVGYEKRDDRYIWAIVLHPINDADTEKNPLMRRYRILITEEDEEGIVVSVLDLFKLITKHSEAKTNEQALVPTDSESGATELRQIRDSYTLKELKLKICKELRLIWELPDEEKTKALRRMCYRYHPDKASPNEKEVYEEAFKFLQTQIDRLEARLPLQDPEDTRAQDSTCQHSRWRSYYDEWETNMKRNEDRRQRRNSSEIPDLGPKIPHSKVDPVEAKRWLRQAESDFEAMNILQHAVHDKKVSCQTLFLAHEVAEKALKAGMYALVGLGEHSLKIHDLTCHASAIFSERPEAAQIVFLASKMESYYLDTRFPNRHPQPKAPVDIYTPTQAIDIAECAGNIIRAIREIVDSTTK